MKTKNHIKAIFIILIIVFAALTLGAASYLLLNDLI